MMMLLKLALVLVGVAIVRGGTDKPSPPPSVPAGTKATPPPPSPTSQPTQPCSSLWRVGGWSEWNSTCNAAHRTRTVGCVTEGLCTRCMRPLDRQYRATHPPTVACEYKWTWQSNCGATEGTANGYCPKAVCPGQTCNVAGCPTFSEPTVLPPCTTQSTTPSPFTSTPSKSPVMQPTTSSPTQATTKAITPSTSRATTPDPSTSPTQAWTTKASTQATSSPSTPSPSSSPTQAPTKSSTQATSSPSTPAPSSSPTQAPTKASIQSTESALTPGLGGGSTTEESVFATTEESVSATTSTPSLPPSLPLSLTTTTTTSSNGIISDVSRSDSGAGAMTWVLILVGVLIFVALVVVIALLVRRSRGSKDSTPDRMLSNQQYVKNDTFMVATTPEYNEPAAHQQPVYVDDNQNSMQVNPDYMDGDNTYSQLHSNTQETDGSMRLNRYSTLHRGNDDVMYSIPSDNVTQEPVPNLVEYGVPNQHDTSA